MKKFTADSSGGIVEVWTMDTVALPLNDILVLINLLHSTYL